MTKQTKILLAVNALFLLGLYSQNLWLLLPLNISILWGWTHE